MSPVVPLFSSVFFPVMCWFIIPKQKKKADVEINKATLFRKRNKATLYSVVLGPGEMYTHKRFDNVCDTLNRSAAIVSHLDKSWQIKLET